MDITTLAAWGEFLGGIAVVASLIYLASQIRQNSRLLRVSMTSSVADSDRMLSIEMVHDPSLRRMWLMDSVEFDSLSDPEQEKIVAFLVLQMSIHYRNYYYATDGAIRTAVWGAEKRVASSMFAREWVRRFWNESRFGYSDEFGTFIDGLIEEAEAAA